YYIRNGVAPLETGTTAPHLDGHVLPCRQPCDPRGESMKRILLFVATNVAVLVLLSIVVRVLNLEPYLQGQGLNLQALLIFAAVSGFGGASLSLAISKWTAKMMTGARVIPQPRTAAESWLLATVQRQGRAAGIRPPEVAIYDAPEPNAFAT